MMKEKFEKIAREGMIRGMIERHGLKMSDHEIRANVALSENLNQLLREAFPELRDPADAQPRLFELTQKAFKKTADDFRMNRDWDGYGATMWLMGAAGFRG